MRGGMGCFCTVSLYDFDSEGNKKFSSIVCPFFIKILKTQVWGKRQWRLTFALHSHPLPEGSKPVETCKVVIESRSRPSTITVWMGRCVVNYYGFLHPFRIYKLCLKVRAWFFCAVNRSFIPKKKKKKNYFWERNSYVALGKNQ